MTRCNKEENKRIFRLCLCAGTASNLEIAQKAAKKNYECFIWKRRRSLMGKDAGQSREVRMGMSGGKGKAQWLGDRCAALIKLAHHGA